MFVSDAVRLLRHGNRFLLLLLVCLKLTGDLTWSWWVILAPAWIPLVALLLGAAVVVLGVLSRSHLRRSGSTPSGTLTQQEPRFMTVRQSFASRPAAR
jgi:hypothetical protein